MNKAFLQSLIGSTIIIALNIFVYVFLRADASESVYAEYSVYKRSLSLVAALSLLGLPTALARNTKINKDPSLGVLGFSILFSSILLFLLFILSTYVEAMTMPLSLWIYTFTLVVLTIIIARNRGLLLFGIANYLSVLSVSILVFSVWFHNTLESAFWSASIGHFLLILMAAYHFREDRLKLEFDKYKNYLQIGVTRLPGDFLFQAMFSIPLIYFSQFSQDSLSIGDFGFTIAVLAVVPQLLKPIGFVSLPYISQLLNDNNLDEKRALLLRLDIVAIICSVFVIIFTYLLVTLEISIINSFIDIFELLYRLRLSFLGLIYYVVYRSVIDGMFVLPMNTLSLVLSVVIMILSLFWFQNDIRGVSYSMNIGFVTLGILSFIWRITDLRRMNE